VFLRWVNGKGSACQCRRGEADLMDMEET